MKSPVLHKVDSDRYKIYLNHYQVGRLIGHKGKTISFLKKKHSKSTITINNSNNSKYYIEFSGKDLLDIYKHITNLL